MSAMDSFRLARDTWGDIRPIVHFSSSRRLYEDAGAKEQAHADYLYDEIPFEVLETADVMVEAKMKEKAVLQYKQKFSILV